MFKPTNLGSAKEMMSVIAPYPFAQWGIDLVGALKKRTNQKTHILVVVDYFTKWAEVEALSSTTTWAIKKFVFNNIVCRYRVPQMIISDNGP